MSKRLGRHDVQTLVLHVLLRGPSHGYAIARAIEQESGQALRLGEGTLYPVLRDLEHSGMVTAEWQTPDSGPARKVYRITRAGRAESTQRVNQWHEQVRAIGAILGTGDAGHA